MNSSKLKWLLIAIFLAANIFFLHQYKTYSDSVKNYTEEEKALAVTTLLKSGIEVSEDAIPDKKTVSPVLKLSLSEGAHENIANHIMSKSFAGYVIPDGIGYTNNSETLVFFNNQTIEYTVNGGVNLDADIANRLQTSSLPDNTKKYVKLLSSKIFSRSLTNSHEMSFVPISSFKEGGIVYLKVHQSINDMPIDGSELLVAFKEDSVVHIKGSVFFATGISELNANSLDPINLLFKIPKVSSEITNVEEIYFPVTTEAGAVYLTPSYKLTCADGNISVWDATSSAQRY